MNEGSTKISGHWTWSAYWSVRVLYERWPWTRTFEPASMVTPAKECTCISRRCFVFGSGGGRRDRCCAMTIHLGPRRRDSPRRSPVDPHIFAGSAAIREKWDVGCFEDILGPPSDRTGAERLNPEAPVVFDDITSGSWGLFDWRRCG